MSSSTRSQQFPPNRLASQSSPYLLQHAYNPVEWWPWGEEAFAEARKRNVPIFLSIGYSTCYWCHVMERESFENEPTAKVMNARFVCIKVDREERPDVDDLYMAAVQMLTGSGGWPMSVFLEPATLRPYWGGTYFPPVPAYGRPSFVQVLERLSGAYAAKRDEVIAQAQTLGDAVAERLGVNLARAPVAVGLAHCERALQSLLTTFDPTNGGFGGAPKFPQVVNLAYLLDARAMMSKPGLSSEAGQTVAAIDRVLRSTLDAMATGGIHDQLGGGFHRYSVDATWTVPHFEKMLYDQAQLLATYARASATYNDGYYAAVARGIGEYLRREMTDAKTGLFYTAQDAEVDGREGLNYTWSLDEINAVFGTDRDSAGLAAAIYGADVASGGPNFQDPHHPDLPARSVLRLAGRPETLAVRHKLQGVEFAARKLAIDEAMLRHRATRKQASTDDKLLTAWNAQMIAALAVAAVELNDAQLAGMADLACAGLLKEMSQADGTLIRARRGQSVNTEAVLEDYALAIAALVAVDRLGRTMTLQHTAAPLAAAERLVGVAAGLFAPAGSKPLAKSGALLDTRAGRSDLFVQSLHTYDGAMPSGASVLLDALVSLADQSGKPEYLERAFDQLAAISHAMDESPLATVNSTRVLLGLCSVPAQRAQLAAAFTARRARTAQTKHDQVVEVLVSTGELTVSGDEPGEFFVRLEIAEGYHINSALAGTESKGLVLPLRLDVPEGSPFSVYVDYPPGEKLFEPDGREAAHTVHSGTVELRVVIERNADTPTGAKPPAMPRVRLSYQACSNSACLQPEHVELPVVVILE